MNTRTYIDLEANETITVYVHGRYEPETADTHDTPGTSARFYISRIEYKKQDQTQILLDLFTEEHIEELCLESILNT